LPDGFVRIQKKFDEHLRAWHDARNELIDEHFKLRLDGMGSSLEIRQLDVIVAALKRMRKIQLIYATIEIAAPVVFAVAAIVSCWFR
jgi:hypothetical protein